MRDLNALALPDLFAALTADGSLMRLVDAAKREDLGETGDVTSACIVPDGTVASADIVAREAGVIAGLAAVPALLQAFAPDVRFERENRDGDPCSAGVVLGRLRGDRRQILGVERTLLNLLGRLSGVATITRRYVQAVLGTHAVICDTRKTTPGLRSLEKYAVRCGGGTLHRLGLHDAVLIKDNHLAGVATDVLSDTLTDAIAAARSAHDLRFVEVEVDTLDQLDRVLECESGLIDIILLDNMSSEDLRAAVVRRDDRASSLQLEASGGVTLETVRAIAETGVDRISVGALTHGAVSLDVALELESS